MPFPFLVILIAGATGYVLTAVLFFITRSMPGINSGTGWWTISSLSAGAGYIILLVMGMLGKPQIGEALYNMLFLLWALGLYLGGREFLDIPVGYRRFVGASFLIVLWLGYFYFISYDFLFSALAVSLFIGVLNIHLAWLFWKKSHNRGAYLNFLVTALTVSGIHWLDYPILRPVESFAPVGFSLCAVISVIISGLLAGTVLRQFRQRMINEREKALDAADHDSLTGLNNRVALERKFEQVRQEKSAKNSKMALIFIDLDNFKPINDELGHRVGDLVLMKIAEKIKSYVRASDIVSRVGGDEFVIVLTNLDENYKSAISRFCEEIIAALSEPFEIDTHHCRIGASIGAIFSSIQNSDLDTMMNLADEAMYKAKADGKGNYKFVHLEEEGH